MTTSSDIPVEFMEKYDLDDEWEVRFTAEEYRAREIAQQYREMGHEVALVPLSPTGDTPNMEELQGFGEDLDLDHDPLQYLEQEECAPCMDKTFVLFTKPEGNPQEQRDADLDGSLYR